MNYELAKQLKDAGFPRHHAFEQSDWENFKAHHPSLEELIEACNLPNFNSFELECINTMKIPNQWLARTSTNDRVFITEWCSTPTEAVARLWLALNRHA
jgi:hypothetical protein